MFPAIKRFFNNQQVKQSTPVVVTLIGLTALIVGELLNKQPTGLDWKSLLIHTGEAVLAGGVFSLLLRSDQFIHIVKDELTDIVYESKFLETRKDLIDIWKRVSKVLFKNEFPGISSEITQDVMEIYFPTRHVLYYENYSQLVEIEVIDPVGERIKVIQHSEFTVCPKEKQPVFEHIARNHIRFEKDRSEVEFKIKSFKVNGVELDPKLEESVENNTLNSIYSINLSECKEYKFQTIIEKEYSLKYDNLIGMAKEHLIHNFELKVVLKGNIKIDFWSMGTLKSFESFVAQNKNYLQYKYNGVIYPKQGYIMIVKLT